jgi:hypothetical protein
MDKPKCFVARGEGTERIYIPKVSFNYVAERAIIYEQYMDEAAVSEGPATLEEAKMKLGLRIFNYIYENSDKIITVKTQLKTEPMPEKEMLKCTLSAKFHEVVQE